MAEIMVSHGADVTVFRNEPLRNAVDKRNFEMVKLLVKAGAELQSTHNYRAAEIKSSMNFPVKICKAKVGFYFIQMSIRAHLSL